MPFSLDAFQGASASVLELNARAGHQVFHRARNQHFTGSRFCGNLRAYLDSNAGELLIDRVAFTRVQARFDLDPQSARGISDRARRTNRTGRPIEAGQDCVLTSFNLTASEPLELSRGQQQK